MKIWKVKLGQECLGDLGCDTGRCHPYEHKCIQDEGQEINPPE